MRYYIVSGERSGDVHGGNLINALKKLDTKATFRGFGGDNMKNAGLDLVQHYNQMAWMGFLTMFTTYNKMIALLKFCKQDILLFHPDVVILIDYGGFNIRVAQFAKLNHILSFYYIPPKIWAWNQRRIKKIKAYVDRLFVILPFEKPFYKKFGLNADFVGSPSLDVVKDFKVNPQFLNIHRLSELKPIVALLPGSRSMELKKIVPLMSEVVIRNSQYQFVVATVDGLDESLYEPLEKLPQVKCVSNDTYNILAHAKAAIVTSGTATLEAGLFKVPQVCVYKSTWFEMKLAKLFVYVKFISLINLIANKLVIKELIQEDATAMRVGEELVAILTVGEYRSKMMLEYEKIIEKLDIGKASENTARLMVQYLSEKR